METGPAGRSSLKQFIEPLTEFDRRKIQLIVLQENSDTTTRTGKLFFHIFGILAEFERNVIGEITRAGLDSAKARVRKVGCKPALDSEQLKIVKARLENSRDYTAIARTVKSQKGQFAMLRLVNT